MELGVDAHEVSASLRPIHPELRRFAALVASPEVEPDDLVQAAVTQVLATGAWRKIHDLRGYLMRAMVRAAPDVRGSMTLDPSGAEITLVATYPSELGDVDPMTRALLYLVDGEDYLVDEAATLVGCSTQEATRALGRIRAHAPRETLDRLSTRGAARSTDAIVAAALIDAQDHAGAAVSRSRRPQWPIAIAVVVALVIAATVVIVRQRDDRTTAPVAAPLSPTRVPTPTTVATFPATAHGWVFNDGLIRDIFDNHPVALFPMKTTSSPPVRVKGGFVAVLADRSLWFAREESAESEQLDTSVEGVAASPGGAAIAYSTVSLDSTSATLKMIDLSSRALMAQLPLDRFARVVGMSNPEVLLDTGDGAASAAAIWDPTGTNRVTYLDAFGSVGGVGRNVAVLYDDGTCGALVTVRNDAIAPLRNIDLAAGDNGCAPSRWEFDASGSLVAGFGMVNAPTELRVSVNRFPVAIGRTRVTGAIWVDSSNLAALDERGELVKCDASARCADVRPVRSPPFISGALWLIPPRRDVADDRTG